MRIPRWLKWIFIIIGGLIGAAVVLFFIYNEPLPKGTSGAEVDQLTQKMYKAVNKPAWDTTRYVRWTFVGMHTYTWDKERHFTTVEWGDTKVLLNINEKTGKVYEAGQLVPAPKAGSTIETAWEYWVNDSFWLNAVVKATDPGTTRTVVTQEDGSKGLLVSYSSGGVTPGDAYLWILDDTGLPKAWKMWVNIIPVGGVEFGWSEWKTLSTGAKVATLHESAIFDLKITDVKAGQSYQAMGYETDPFAQIDVQDQ